jgi:transcriptional regulator with XRE-family HTH domain
VNLAERLAEALRRLREEAGMTQKDLAKRLKMSHATLHRLERGDRNTMLTTLEDLSEALGCSLADLFEPGRLKIPPRRAQQTRRR